MDNENGTAVAEMVTTKVEEQKSETVTSKTDAIENATAMVETVKGADVANLEPKLVEAAIDVKSDEIKAVNNQTSNDVAVSKTTTTVTVNVTQTKVTVNDETTNNKSQELGEVVSTVASIAGAAVDAVIDKVEHELKKSDEVSDAVALDDIEMVEADTDCEMKDATQPDEPAQSVDTTSGTVHIDSQQSKTVEADSAVSTTATSATTNDSNALVASSNEAEHKIDDVEKNISNLFNGGDDNVVSTNDKSIDDDDDLSKIETSIASSQNDIITSLKNGTNDDGSKEKHHSHDDKDNNDLVSILAGNDKPDENISSSISGAASAAAATASKDASEAIAAKPAQLNSIENKLLKGVTSTPSNTTTQTNVYNSTPIQKQFEISSENVSTISEPAIDTEHGLGSKATKQEIISSHSSTINEKSLDLSAATVTGSESSSSDNIASFTKVVGTINGLSDETDGSSVAPAKSAEKVVKEKPATSVVVDSSEKVEPSETKAAEKLESMFDINICYDNAELVYFSVERQQDSASKITTGSDKSSLSASAGSVHSVAEPFTLPSRFSTLTANSSTLSSSSSEAASVPTTTTNQMVLDRTRQEIKGTEALCQFIIDHFEKLRAKVAGTKSAQSTTPATSGGRRGKNSNAEPSTPSTATKRKRGAAAVESPANEIDADAQPKSAKKSKKEPTTPKTAATPAAAAESDYPEKAVLARWVDKKFYAGRVIDQKPNNKYVVLFEDGAKKTLPEEHIVFGKENILPLLNESVHALVVGETYEPGIVQSVETKDDGVFYTVQCESTTITVTASDIYLEEDQAKLILSKHASNNPEPGFSGGLNTRKDRRNKRAESNRQVQWFSESDVSDINESDSRPASPVTVLEAVDGVQPELQHTQKESELVRICYLMERFGSDFKKVNLDSVLGPIIQSNILKNKSFLLTCTIPIKAANGTTERQGSRSNGFDLNNRNTVFSTVPFFKDHLKQQIELAGGTVYSNFENVPVNKYRSCFLLSPFPCITAKYVQCLAANITAVSHEWIVESCHRNKLLNKDEFVLPAGWSIIENKYKPWSTSGRSQRKNAFSKTTIILTSQQSDFVEFWTRVCKSAGAKIRLVKSVTDLTATTKGYILLDDEFPIEYQNRAERFHIPIVSTVWVIQSLILGKVCDPNAHPKLTQLYEDDYY